MTDVSEVNTLYVTLAKFDYVCMHLFLKTEQEKNVLETTLSKTQKCSSNTSPTVKQKERMR